MLYIANVVVLIIWFVYIVWRKTLTWHTIVNVYTFSVMVVDISEVLFNQISHLYRFSTQLFSVPSIDNQFGIILSDGIILPLGALILTSYARQRRPWRAALLCIFGELMFELIYLKLGYLHYIHWSIWASTLCYLLGIGIYSHYAPRFVHYNPPIPYWVRISGVVYTLTAWIGAVLGGAFFRLYQWHPGMVTDNASDDRFADLGLSLVMGILCAILVPRISTPIRQAFIIGLASISAVFALFMNRKGILIYHHWNGFLTLARYFVPFILIIWYDRWETQFDKRSIN